MSEVIENVQPDVVEESSSFMDVTSFDDLEDNVSNDDFKENEANVEEESEAETYKDGITGENEAETPEAKSEEEVKEGEAETKEAIEEIKNIMAQSGEKEIELSPETMFKHKVDGEEVEVNLQELLNNYSGKVPYDKRFQELSEDKKSFSKERDSFQTEKTQINDYINTFGNKMKEGKALDALAFLAEFSGQKPHEFKDALIQQLSPEVDRLRTLNEEQISNERLQAENDYILKKYESEEKIRQQEQAGMELKRRVYDLQEAYNISEEDYNISYEELQSSNFDGELTPEIAVEYHRHKNAFMLADEITSKIDPALSKQEEVINSVQKMIFENPNLTHDDYSDLVKDVYGSVRKENSQAVSDKIPETEKNSQVNQKKKPVNDFENYMDFDEL
jgi:hypothetical protein